MPPSFRELKGLDVYTSSPYEQGDSKDGFTACLREVAQWSDEYGCRGMLIYTDNHSLDPWVLAQDVITHTNTLSPLIAVQPVYMHPYAAAQKVSALTCLYSRAIDLNFVAGGFQFDLAALGDPLEHDARYDRLSEYGSIVTKLLRGDNVTLQGKYYRLMGLKFDRPISAKLFPNLTVSGSSTAGLDCAGALGAVAVMYPKPKDLGSPSSTTFPSGAAKAGVGLGIRIGILTRETTEEAWKAAELSFPSSTAGKVMQEAAVLATDSSWLQQLSGHIDRYDSVGRGIYWLGPFANAQSFCPYLVGSYNDVSSYLLSYVKRGVRLIILDSPREKDDLAHAHVVLQRAVSAASAPADGLRIGQRVGPFRA